MGTLQRRAAALRARQAEERTRPVGHLLQPNERVLDHSLAMYQSVVPPPAPSTPRIYEVVLLITDRRLLWYVPFPVDRARVKPSGVAGPGFRPELHDCLPYEWVDSWVVKRRSRWRPIARSLASLVVDTKTDQVMKFQGGWAAFAVAHATLQNAVTWDWSGMEQTVAYFYREEQLHGRFGLIPGVLRCATCDTNLWPPRPFFCPGCGRRLDWAASEGTVDEFNAAAAALNEHRGES